LTCLCFADPDWHVVPVQYGGFAPIGESDGQVGALGLVLVRETKLSGGSIDE